jgi:N-acylneuraminate cytidylyltransferase
MEACIFDHIYVDTDSEEINNYCADNGLRIIERKKELAENTANGNDLLNYHHSLFANYEFYFQCFATAPFLKPETIRQCVQELKINSGDFDSILTATEVSGWHWFNNQPVNYRPNVLPRSQDAKKVVRESTGLYGITREALNKYKCRIGANPIFYFISESEAVDLDTEDDFRYANWRILDEDR